MFRKSKDGRAGTLAIFRVSRIPNILSFCDFPTHPTFAKPPMDAILYVGFVSEIRNSLTINHFLRKHPPFTAMHRSLAAAILPRM
jgi:hypothetical protein